MIAAKLHSNHRKNCSLSTAKPLFIKIKDHYRRLLARPACTWARWLVSDILFILILVYFVLYSRQFFSQLPSLSWHSFSQSVDNFVYSYEIMVEQNKMESKHSQLNIPAGKWISLLNLVRKQDQTKDVRIVTKQNLLQFNIRKPRLRRIINNSSKQA